MMSLALGSLSAAAACLAFTPLVIRLAHARSWIARPRADRWSPRPTALMGGIAIYAATMLGAGLSGGIHRGTAVLWASASAIFLLGLVDDRCRLRPHVKLVGQVAAACWLMASGVHLSTLPLLWSLPLTILWLIGTTNALNLLDNMDGLAAGVAGIAALVISAYGILMGDLALARMALPLAGACAGFLCFNSQPARIFMGDCGSMFLGFTLGAVAILGTRRTVPNLMLPLFVPVAALIVPIFDTTLVTVTRRLAGRPVSEGGRDHSSHRLVALGFSERGTVLALYLLSSLFGGLAIWAIHLPLLVTAVTAVLLFLVLAGVGTFLGMVQVHSSIGKPASNATVLGGRIRYGKQVAQVLLDLVLVPLAYVGSYLLLFNGRVPEAMLNAIVATLPFMIAIKLMALSISRAHRGVWRYAGMADVLGVLKGSSLGSLVCGLMIARAVSAGGVPGSVFVIDWLLFTNLAVVARTGLTALRRLFASLPRNDAPRTLIVGATPAGIAVADTLSDPHRARPAIILGFLDEDPANQQRTLNGHPVLGTLADLESVLREERPDQCVLAVDPGSPEADQAAGVCGQHGVASLIATAVLFAPAAAAPLPEPAPSSPSEAPGWIPRLGRSRSAAR